MTVLLDTNVVSEWARPEPDPGVRDWLNDLDEERTFISAVSVAELQRGILLLSPGRRRDRLADWFAGELLPRFGERCLPVGRDVALEWARLSADARQAGRPLDVLDGFVAATAATHRLTLATRNIRHFAACGIPLLDPWAG